MVTSPVKDASGNSQPPRVDTLYTGTIPPRQTSEYVFSGQEAQSGLLHSVIVTTEAKPGTYQAKLVSRSTGIMYQVELLAKQTREMNNAGVHPWTVQGDNKSHIVLFNYSKDEAKVGIFISSGTKIVWASEIFIAPQETREISINDLQREQIPDDQGRRIPLSLKNGVADWRTPFSGKVTGRLMVTSHDGAMARNYSCGTYYGVCNLLLWTYYQDILSGGELPMYGVTANYCDFNPNAPTRCVNGSPTSGSLYINWTVGATNIIALSSPSQSGASKPMLTGVSAGKGTASVEVIAGSCTGTGGGTPTVQQPNQIFVTQDVTGTVNCTFSSSARTITYTIEDSTGNPLTMAIPIHENVPVTTSSCNNGIVQTGTGCLLNNLYAPGTLDQFNDYLWAGCPSSSQVEPCGFTFQNQQWQYCPTGLPASSIGTVGTDKVGNVIISVDGNITSLIGTTFLP